MRFSALFELAQLVELILFGLKEPRNSVLFLFVSLRNFLVHLLPFFPRVTYLLILSCLFLFHKYCITLKIIILRQAEASIALWWPTTSLFTTSTAASLLRHHYWIVVDAAKMLEQATNTPETSRRANIDKKSGQKLKAYIRLMFSCMSY